MMATPATTTKTESAFTSALREYCDASARLLALDGKESAASLRRRCLAQYGDPRATVREKIETDGAPVEMPGGTVGNMVPSAVDYHPLMQVLGAITRQLTQTPHFPRLLAPSQMRSQILAGGRKQGGLFSLHTITRDERFAESVSKAQERLRVSDTDLYATALLEALDNTPEAFPGTVDMTEATSIEAARLRTRLRELDIALQRPAQEDVLETAVRVGDRELFERTYRATAGTVPVGKLSELLAWAMSHRGEW